MIEPRDVDQMGNCFTNRSRMIIRSVAILGREVIIRANMGDKRRYNDL